MASVDFNERQLTIKLVYYGPPLSGKTTNLRWIHAHVAAGNRGRLMTLDTRDDRTLFFDLLPIFFESAGLSFRLKIYTVPGQPTHELTRRLVLKAVDGVAFVADSQRSCVAANQDSYDSLCRNLGALDLASVPVVIQYNKRDLPDIVGEPELSRFGRPPGESMFTASALAGTGVPETFLDLLRRTWDSVDASVGMGRSFGIDRENFIAAVRRHMRLPAHPADPAAAPSADPAAALPVVAEDSGPVAK